MSNNVVINFLLLIIIGYLIYILVCNETCMDEMSNCNIKEDMTIIPSQQFKSSLLSNNTPQELQSVPVVQNNYNPTQPANTIHNFTSNNAPGSLVGAELNEAFISPKPPELSQQEINMKKCNMEQYNIKDYLPDPDSKNVEWFETDFAQAQHRLSDDNLINPDRYIIGINTVGQSLKNASYDLRGTQPNPKYSISPWNNSTYETDYNIKSLC